MKSIEFKDQNVIFAKDQPEYENLPAHVQHNGMVLFGFQLDDEDMKLIKEKGHLDITRLTLVGPSQPTKLFLKKSIDLPLDHTMVFDRVSEWNDKKDEATYRLMVVGSEIKLLDKIRVIWVVTFTSGSPLQPVRLTI